MVFAIKAKEAETVVDFAITENKIASGVVNENDATDIECKWVSFNGNAFGRGSSDEKIFSF